MPDSRRIVLATGAGQGIGESIARCLASEGAHVIIADINTDNAQRVASDLPSAAAASVDVRSVDDVTALIERVHREHGRLDILVNNAAITKNTGVFDIDQEEWDAVLEVNLRSIFFACKAAAPLMRRRGWGRIINLSSLAGQQGGLVAGAHYAASKAGIIVLTKIFARELAGDGVTVNSVAPAAIDGPMLQQLPPERVAEIAKTIPVGRVGSPTEVAATVAFLCSEDAGYITGATVDINGGIAMR